MNRSGQLSTVRQFAPPLPTSSGQLSDSQLIRRAQCRDSEATATLYKRYYPAVLAYCRARINDSDAAADAASGVIEKMLRGLPYYRDTGVPFQAWLHRIARNHVLDTIRKERTRPVLVDMETLSESGCMSKGFERILHDDVIRVCWTALTDIQRVVLKLRYVEGYDFGSIATAVNRTRAATKSIHFRAIRTLRKALQQTEEADIGAPLLAASRR